MSTWWVAVGALALLLLLAAGAWLVTVIVRRSNRKVADVDTEPYEVSPGGGKPPEAPPPAA